jgi:nuclear transcription factor Y gamma
MGSSQELSAQAAYDAFWPKATEEIRGMDLVGLKHQELPLARIKKVRKGAVLLATDDDDISLQIMKLDDDVKMISAEAPVLFAKAAEMFITELTMRAWIHTEDNKRRTLQRNDIAMAITK